MDRITVSIRESQIDLLDELSADGGPCDNRSESMRLVIDEYENDKNLEEKIAQLEDEKKSLESRLEESRRREIARDRTNDKIDTLRADLRESQQMDDGAPFFVRWVRWYRRR